MTSKEHVQEIYPTAIVKPFSYGDQTLWEVYVIYHTKHQRWESPINRFSREGYTKERAWDRAWKIIQKEMLEKLEE